MALAGEANFNRYLLQKKRETQGEIRESNQITCLPGLHLPGKRRGRYSICDDRRKTESPSGDHPSTRNLKSLCRRAAYAWLREPSLEPNCLNVGAGAHAGWWLAANSTCQHDHRTASSCTKSTVLARWRWRSTNKGRYVRRRKPPLSRDCIDETLYSGNYI